MVIFQNRYIQAAQQLVRLWSGARGAQAGPVAPLQTELESVAEQTGVDLALARRLTPESLGLLVAPGGTTDPLRCWIVAEICYVAGRFAHRRDDEVEALEWGIRALHLYRRLDPDHLPDAGLPDPRDRIAELEARLEGPD